jgi:hypothetical protein
VRRLAALALAVLALAAGAVALGARPAAAEGPAVSRDEAIAKLGEVRVSIDRTLALIKAGRAEEAFAEARAGYLDDFELVEVPLRVADNDLTITAEGVFAEIRQAIRSGSSVGEVRDLVVQLRGLIDDAERRLTALGVAGPALVTGQSFLILFREGFEVVLLVSVLPARCTSCGRSSSASASPPSPPPSRSWPCAWCSRPCPCPSSSSRRSPRWWPWRCSSTSRSGSSPGWSTSGGWSS